MRAINVTTNRLNVYYIISILYLGILLFSCFTNIPYVDSYYYWLWSKNLQLSYVDGPPMIGYVIRLSTIIFGNSVFAINFVGVVIAVITSLIILRIANLLFESKYNFIIALLWFTSYTVTAHRIINFVTYDGLVNLFELIIIMYALKYIKFRQNSCIYLIGIFAGLALLSKYSAIILLTTLIGYFIYCKELQIVFKQVHIYLSMLLCVIIFSPVLIWNYQHHWVSFIFQLTYHNYNAEYLGNSAIERILYYVKQCILGPLAPWLIILLFLIYTCYKQRTTIKMRSIFQTPLSIKFIFILMISIFSFWLFVSISAAVPDRYMLLLYSLTIIVMGIILLQQQYYKLLLAIIVANAIWSIGSMVDHSLRIRNPTCYTRYIDSELLQFNSPFMQYITVYPNAPSFCYYDIKQE
jgi:4-amino-4-deoxy-L-arabinose transferase-like glycosyltransferase